VVGDGDEIEAGLDRRVHELRGRDHAVGRKRMAVRVCYQH
jgi:hypothetical protein